MGHDFSVLDLLTMDEAARATSLSRDTIKRRLRRGDFPGAIRGTPHGKRPPPWLIPVVDLIAAGLTVVIPDDSGTGQTASDEVLAVRLARAEATVAARDVHVADLRAELRRLHDHVERLSGRGAQHACGDCSATADSDGSGLPIGRSPDGHRP